MGPCALDDSLLVVVGVVGDAALRCLGCAEIGCVSHLGPSDDGLLREARHERRFLIVVLRQRDRVVRHSSSDDRGYFRHRIPPFSNPRPQ